ncbi:hypothetical protein [Bradyrhizobium erythrophlei]|uniref:hypothetical protein n=1 Tax=Bradyrhizobium erythrophlei TaxID=1437360 RepID=UPI0012AB614A|nr:hypothetical protein [Bradyrhizobium erythrophlei]
MKGDIERSHGDVCFVPSPDSCIAAIVSSSITLPGAPDEQCWNEIRRRRRLLSPRVLSNTLSTASVMASTPVSMVGFGTGANKGELVARQLQAVALAGRAATRSGS